MYAYDATFGLYDSQYKGRDAKSINVLAENDIISLDGIKENLAYTLVTQREPDNQVYHKFDLLVDCTKIFAGFYNSYVP